MNQQPRNTSKLSILVIGAGGYIGSKLVGRLLSSGYAVRCLVRDKSKLTEQPWLDEVEIYQGDVLDPESIAGAFTSVTIVYYLIHSMANPRGNFADLDRLAARNAGRAARFAGVSRIIYLGGLGRRREEQSPHLKSRHEVGDVLRESGVPVTEFRAAAIIGSGSLSFEMIHHLANRLPVMICPRWVVTQTQPIAIEDVLAYLVSAPKVSASAGRVLDIGGPEVLTYGDMMMRVARALGLRRWLLEVPVLTPRLSSYWVGLVTPVPVKPAQALIEGLRHETVCENDDARDLFSVHPTSFDKAVKQALVHVLPDSHAHPGSGQSIVAQIEPSHLLVDRRRVMVEAPAAQLFRTVCAIGGVHGWYAADFLWKLRGMIDEWFGGVGLRRGRRDPDELVVGDSLDFWRVEEYVPGARLLLRAEMKLPGKAWLEFDVQSLGPERSQLTQTARFYPRGLAGIMYWYAVYPVHIMVFRRMSKAIGKRAERLARMTDQAG